MPYINEYSKHKSVSDLINSKKVKEFMSSMKVLTRDKANFEKIDKDILITPEDLDVLKSEQRLKYVFAFDGSKTQISLDTGYPGAEVGIIKISQSFIQLELMKKYEEEEFPHPSNYDEIFLNQNFEVMLPGFNVCSEIYGDPRDFFRFTLFDYLKNNYNTFMDVLTEKAGVDFKPLTFLDTYISLLKKKGGVTAIYPCELCCANSDGHDLLVSYGDFQVDNYDKQDIELVDTIKCNCKTNPRDVFITDLLHFHEGFSSSGSNDGVYTQVMSFLEKIIFMNLVQNIKHFFETVAEGVDNPIFRDCAFILDGPLAIYNYASWFASALSNEMIELADENILVLGIEKTGHFMDHLRNLDAIVSPEDKPLTPGFMFFLDDAYIKRYIKYTTSPVPYGKNVYFGKKLYYKNHDNKLFVLNLAYNSHDDKETYLNARNQTYYRVTQLRLRDIAWLLEKYASSRYENALSFVSMAHENASISTNYFSKRVIDDFIHTTFLNESDEC